MTQWETPAILPNRNRAPPTCPPPLLTKKCILCLLPRLSAINPGSTSDVALPPFPRVTALYAIIIAASLRVYVCVCVCALKGEQTSRNLAACMPVYRCKGEGGGGNKGTYWTRGNLNPHIKRPCTQAEARREGGRRQERGRQKQRGEREKGKKVDFLFQQSHTSQGLPAAVSQADRMTCVIYQTRGARPQEKNRPPRDKAPRELSSTRSEGSVSRDRH